jgi:hypothetical protein
LPFYLILLLNFDEPIIEEKLARFSVNSDILQIQAFINEVYQAAVAIWSYMRKVLGLTLRCEIRTNNFPLLVDHISREAAYFANRLKELNEGKLAPQPDTIIQENLFFLKIMADHAKFIGHLLDPSEQKLEQAADYNQD